jgi:predicted Zn-dependent protease
MAKSCGGKLISAFAALVVGLTLAFSVGVSPASAQGVIRDAEIEQTLRGYLDPLLEAADLNPKEVRLVILQDPSLNAFVSNGQMVFVHTGLILAAENANELKGVLAHETGHISGGHLARSREAMQQAMAPAWVSIGLGILAAAAGAPDAAAALISGSQQFAMASFVQHTQAQESAADQAAVTLLDETGQSGRGLLEFANRQFRYNELLSARRIPPWMRTHPLWSDRIQALRGRVEAGKHFAAEELPQDAERFAMMQAKLRGYLDFPNQTLRRYPPSDTSLPARYARAIAAMRQPDFALAKREADALVAEQPDNPFFQELLAEIALNNGRANDAVKHNRQSLAMLPNNALLQVNLARALINLKQDEATDEAVLLLQRVTQVGDPDNVSAWHELSMAYDQLGQDGMARLAAAEVRFRIGDFPAAKSFAERAKERLEKDTPSFRRANDISTTAETRLRQGRRG